MLIRESHMKGFPLKCEALTMPSLHPLPWARWRQSAVNRRSYPCAVTPESNSARLGGDATMPGKMALTRNEIARRYYERRLAEIAKLPTIPCACGCGTVIPPISKKLRPARYAHGHNPDGIDTRFEKGLTPWNIGKKGPPSPRKGIPLTSEQITLRAQTRRSRNGGVYSTNAMIRSGIANRPRSWLANVTAANRRRDLAGPSNPAWMGGLTREYGPGFTRRLRAAIRDRDGHRCQRCGMTEARHGRTLVVHHIDHNKRNHDPANLLTVCHPCNVWFSYHRQTPVKMRLMA